MSEPIPVPSDTEGSACLRCGAGLGEADTSCTRCGAPRAVPLGTPLPPPAEATSQDAPQTPRPVIPPGGWGQAGVAAVIGGALAVVLWLIVGPGSLLLDLVACLWVAAVAVTARLVVRKDDLEAAMEGLFALGAAVRRSFPLNGVPAAGSPVGVVLLAVVPLVTGIVCSFGAAAHHSSDDDVCSAYQKYREATDTPSESTFDSAWFDALDHLGKVASDYGGPLPHDEIRAAGKQARQIAKGTGSGIIVSANVGEAEAAVAPLAQTCAGGD